MCKIMTLTGIEPGTVGTAWQFVQEMAKEMSLQNQHGLGYAAINKEGKLFGERWLDNGEAFTKHTAFSELEEEVLKEYDGMLQKEVKYNRFGNVDDQGMSCISMHARLATSGKVFANTHPFVHYEKTDTALIHNGVIQNTSELQQHVSTCDSECILNEYVKYKVYDNPTAIQDVADSLIGYYACAVLSKDSSGRVFLDVFKDKQASLSAAYVKELKTVVFSTSATDIESVCRKLDLHILSKFEVRSETMLRIDALTGKTIGTYKFKAGKKKTSSHNNITRYSRQHETPNTGSGGGSNYKGFTYDVEKEEWILKQPASAA